MSRSKSLRPTNDNTDQIAKSVDIRLVGVIDLLARQAVRQGLARNDNRLDGEIILSEA